MLIKYEIYNRLLLLFVFVFIKIALFGQIIVSPNQTASDLAHNLAGQGVTIINPTLNCPSVANGLFSTINSNLGLDSGIVLTTGRAQTHGYNYGVNGLSTNLASNNNGAPGDAQLEVLAGIVSTFDACSLEFDVVPYGDTIKFNYVFSSEEYINSVCGPYNDAFAFFISGAGITGSENMAMVPGTTIPVTINSVNNGVAGPLGNISNCTSMGLGSPFTSYYIDNTNGTTFTHKGFTTVMQAIHHVNPCNTYHLKIVIADAGDALYDSGVFLKAGSLQTGSFNISSVAPIAMDSPFSFCIKGCLPGKFIAKRTQTSSQPQTLKLVAGGTAISGIDYLQIPDTVIIPANANEAEIAITGLPTPLNGTKLLKLYIVSPYTCSGNSDIIDSASMVIYDTLHISLSNHDTSICASDRVQLYVTGSELLTYSWAPANYISNAGINDPIVFPKVNTTYTVTASVVGTPCPTKTEQVNFDIKLTPDIKHSNDTIICYNRQVPLNAVTITDNLYYSYAWQGPAGFSSTQKTPAIEHINLQTSGIYTVCITIDTNGCKSMGYNRISAYIPDTPAFVSPNIVCYGDSVKLNIVGNDVQWYTSQEDTISIIKPTINSGSLTNYQFFVSQTLNECESPRVGYSIEIKKCCDGIIFIPTAFSPNGDGKNDKFVVHEDYGYFIKNMAVFNRWGQMVYSGTDGIWDGKYLGANAEIGTYFYNITFGCIKSGTVVKNGDVTLVR